MQYKKYVSNKNNQIKSNKNKQILKCINTN